MPTRFRLKEILDEKGMSQSELKRRSGVSFTTINAMVNNKTRQVHLDTLDSLAKTLDVEPADFLVRRSR